ncbi:MAG: desulfoferrodoxin [Clostridia bacterium]|nr:desulfoferrodoxin [Clostridia bacterium]
MKFLKCPHCGNIAVLFEDSGVTPVCCGEKMVELTPGSVDAALEKHVPVVSVDGDKVTVTVGSVEHPMLEAHHIAWIVLETENGFMKAELDPVGKPCAEFALAAAKPVAAYEYCNLHGLWKADIA